VLAKRNKTILTIKTETMKTKEEIAQWIIDEINKNTKPLIDEIADLKSRLELSEQKVKLNYNTAIDLESKLKASGSVNEGLKSDVDFWKNKSFTLQQENLKHTL